MKNTLTISEIQKKNLSKPDERRTFDKGQVELVTLGGITFGRATFQPGWKWSTCVKPIAQTESCEAPHLQYHISGRIHVVMDDGTEKEFGPGDVSLIPPGHDAWVVGNEPVVVIDISGMIDYAKRN
jgi:mannose-6-phosphate isomerase-like protein (cupin superfamily)